jgi:hypothetical protein
MRFIVVLTCTLLFAACAQAAPASRNSVEAMFSVFDVEKVSDANYQALTHAMDNALASQFPGEASDEQRESLRIALGRVAALLRSEMGWEKLKPEFEQIYIDTFTQDEIDGVLAFYRSPAGQKMIARIPAVLASAGGFASSDSGTSPFTQEEQDAMAGFSRTPAGRAMLEKKSVLSARIEQMIRAHMQKLRPRFAEIMKDMVNSSRAQDDMRKTESLPSSAGVAR